MIQIIFSKYWITRIIFHIKKKGLFSFLKNLLFFLNRYLNPRHSGIISFEILLSNKRRIIKNFVKKNLMKFDDINIKTFFNYYLNQSKIDENSIIYSFGLSNNINFELDLIKKTKCRVFCYDPTEISLNFFKKFNNPNIIFKPIGIYNYDGLIKFYLGGKEGDTSGSICSHLKDDTQIHRYYQCKRLSSLMKSNNHFHIDVLKLDIEGVAIDVINDFISENIFPKQICAEFEYSEKMTVNETDINNWLNKINKLLCLMKENNYQCYHMPKFSHLPYNSIEILFIKK